MTSKCPDFNPAPSLLWRNSSASRISSANAAADSAPTLTGLPVSRSRIERRSSSDFRVTPREMSARISSADDTSWVVAAPVLTQTAPSRRIVRFAPSLLRIVFVQTVGVSSNSATSNTTARLPSISRLKTAHLTFGAALSWSICAWVSRFVDFGRNTDESEVLISYSEDHTAAVLRVGQRHQITDQLVFFISVVLCPRKASLVVEIRTLGFH